MRLLKLIQIKWKLLVVITVITLFNTCYYIYVRTRESLTLTRSDNLASIAELNSTAGAIKEIRLDAIGTSLSVGETPQKIQDLITSIETLELKNSSWLERIIDKKEADRINNHNAQIRKELEFIKAKAENLRFTVTELKKYLSYSPSEDFKQLGQDRTVDDERIERTRLAINSLLDKDLLNNDVELRDDLKTSLQATLDFSATRKLEVFSQSITDSQKNIIIHLQAEVSDIQNSVTKSYSEYIYQ